MRTFILGGGDNIVTTPFFVTQTFTREDGKWWLTAMVFTTRTTHAVGGLVKTGKVSFKSGKRESRHALVGKSLYLLQ